MRLLLDTHAFWWARTAPAQLRARAADAIEDPTNDVYVSAISLYELAFKLTLRKLQPRGGELAEVAAGPYEELPVSAKHALAAGELPVQHRDPFDRILVAQARLEGLTVVTRDPCFAEYGVPTLAA